MTRESALPHSQHSPVAPLLRVKVSEARELVTARNQSDLYIALLFLKRVVAVLKPLARHFE